MFHDHLIYYYSKSFTLLHFIGSFCQKKAEFFQFFFKSNFCLNFKNLAFQIHRTWYISQVIDITPTISMFYFTSKTESCTSALIKLCPLYPDDTFDRTQRGTISLKYEKLYDRRYASLYTVIFISTDNYAYYIYCECCNIKKGNELIALIRRKNSDSSPSYFHRRLRSINFINRQVTINSFIKCSSK